MCGILFSTSHQISENLFQRSLDKMSYRGPDARGVLKTGNFQLGHRRLAIIDLDERADQPFVSRDGRLAIVFNGEIYNFKDLAKKYQLILRTQSDTEVLLALYQELGIKMLHELNGMFTFVIIDLFTHEWIVARDRLGVKPLYQIQWGRELIISSEPAPLLEILKTKSFDPIAVRQYRKLRTFFNGRTIWKGITEFPAGHYLTSNKKLIRWWELPTGDSAIPDDEEIEILIKDAIKLREIADVKVGSYLSGGLDSSIVAGLANTPDTWTVGFKDDNEFHWASLAANHFKTKHHETVLEYSTFLSLAAEMINKRAEPLSVPNEVLLYRMTRDVAQNNKVILSGEGADELFFGYDRIFKWAANNTWDVNEFSKLYSYGSVNDLEIIEDAISPFLERQNTLAIVAAFFQIAHLRGLLRRLDSATMLCSIEARTPFVDYRLVERCAGLPFSWRMQDNCVKAPLKRIFANIIPEAIITRPKVGFTVPLEKITFKNNNEKTAMDCWFEFNLSQLANAAVLLEDVT